MVAVLHNLMPAGAGIFAGWRRVTALASLSAAALCVVPTVHAQSNVTLYGLLDNGLTYVNNEKGKPLLQAQDGVQQNNRFGLLGSEDIGGGDKVIFRLENGFGVNNGTLGQGGLLFGRQAYVGLASDRWGQVTIGRQYDFMLRVAPYFPCLECGIYAVSNGDIDRASGQRLNNAIEYESPSYGGFHVGAMYAFAQHGTGATNAGRAYSLLAEYVTGSFGVIGVVTDIRDVSLSPYTFGLTSLFGAALASNPIVVMSKQRIAAIATSYSIGDFKVVSMYSNTQLTKANAQATDQTIRIGGQYWFAPSARVSAAISTNWLVGARWSQISFGAEYFLSKGTDLYVDGELQRATGGNAIAYIAQLGPSSTNQQVAFRVGIRHRF